MDNNLEFHSIPGYSRYRISYCGKVVSFTGHELSVRLGRNGYYQVSATRDDGRHGSVEIHRLVALAFIPNNTGLEFNQLEVNHIDGIKTNNTPTNLEWCTHSYNERHAFTNGLKSSNTEIHAMSVCGHDDLFYYGLGEAARQFGCPVATMQYQLNTAKKPYKGYWFGYCGDRSNTEDTFKGFDVSEEESKI